ncbi:helix-turn-helix domain-containing protein [Kitasatospora phosalacinea]|uniref:helix-turn-helix domain-containing protein n=1 Tax=Kitasatospora phosalacinea TaxID=2065 RepID=UPI0025568ABD|nr:helix-turn-helix transcriptional regulator [Kitasatospora phosalacinea]
MGLRARELRVSRGLSLSELARRSGIGKATLSELEAGRRNPTLETLYALTTALGLPLSAALLAPSDAADISGRALDAVLLERFGDAAAVCETYRVRIRAGAVQRSAPHTPGATEHLVVLSGTARAGDAAAPARAGPGGCLGWAADVPHLYEAPAGDVHAVLVVRYPHRAARGPEPAGPVPPIVSTGLPD